MTSVTLHSRIPEIMATLPERLEGAALTVAEEIASLARERVPVSTGQLRDSIEAKPIPTGAGVVAEFYWFFQEFGTSSQGARPFMIPAFEQTRPTVSAIVHRWLTSL